MLKQEKFLYPIILSIIFVVFTILTWGIWGNPYYDCFREVSLPLEVLNGKIPYKDFTCIYPPLAYQLNAFLYLIFGKSINVMYFAGILNSIIILCCSYFLVKKMSNHNIAFLSTLLIMALGTLQNTGFDTMNWFFPYSYSVSYAFTCLMLAIIFLFEYVYSKNDKKLYLSSLLIGLSVAFKPDFMLFYIVILFFTIKDFSFKKLFFSIILYILPLTISVISLFIQGFTIQDFNNQIALWHNFQNASTLVEFNKQAYPTLTDVYNLGYKFWLVNFIMLLNVIFLILPTIPAAFVNNFIHSSKAKYLPLFLKLILMTLLSIIAIKITVSVYFDVFHKYVQNCGIIFNFTVFAGLIGMVVKYLKNLSFSQEDKYFIFLAISGILAGYRTIFAPSAGTSYNLSFSIFIMASVILYFSLIYNNISKDEAEKVEKAEKKSNILKNIIIIFCLSMICCWYISSQSSTVIFQNEQGEYKGNLNYSSTLKLSVDYANKFIPKEAKLLVIPEGEIVNYFSGHELNAKYYSLIPHMIEMYGEDYIIEDLLHKKENRPDYIMIYSKSYVGVSGGGFGFGFGQKLLSEIAKEYYLVTIIQSPKITKDFEQMSVLKLKNND